MAVTEISPKEYGKLLSKALPKVIETRDEFDRYVRMMEDLDRRTVAGIQLSPEEEALLALLEKLVADYDDKIELPKVPPHKMVQFLLEHRDLKQADLVPVIGTRAQVSDLVNGKRGISKAQAKKLATFFRISAELFI